MADFSALKTAIQANIRTNGNEEITGAILQEVLLSMVTTMGDGAINGLVTALQEEVVARQNAVGGEATARQNADSALSGRINGEATARGEADTLLQNAINGITTRLNEGYVYVGIATPSTNPGTPAGKVFYIALQGGTYTNFSGLTVTQGINILKYNGSAWSLEQLVGIDDEPTAGSNNLVKSGGVLKKISSYIDDSVNNYIFDLNQFNVYHGFIYTDGSMIYNESWRAIEDYIKIPEGFTSLYMYSAIDDSHNAFYDSSKQWVKNFGVSQGLNKVPIPSNAVYFRVSSTTAAFPEIKIYNRIYDIENKIKDLNTDIEDLKSIEGLVYCESKGSGAYNPNNGYEGDAYPAGTYGNYKNSIDVSEYEGKYITVHGGDLGYIMQFTGTPSPSNYNSQKVNANHKSVYSVIISQGTTIITINSFDSSLPFVVVSDGAVNINDIEFAKLAASSIFGPLYINKGLRLINDFGMYNIPWASYGDSITEQGRWQPYVQWMTGLGTHTNLGVSATCLSNHGSNPMTSQARIDGVPADIKLLIVMGGTNDWAQDVPLGDGVYNPSTGFDITTFKGAVAYLIKAFQQKLGLQTKLYFATPCGGRTIQPDQNENVNPANNLGLTTEDYANAMIEECHKYGVRCIDVYGKSGISVFNKTLYLADTVHPNDEGGKKLAELFASEINKDIIYKQVNQ